MKKNHNIAKLLTVAFMAIGSVSQICAMDDVSSSASSGTVSKRGGGHEEEYKSADLVIHRERSMDVSFCDILYNPRISMGEVFHELYFVRLGGVDPSLDSESSENHRKIMDEVVRYGVGELNKIKDHAREESLMIVSRLVNFWLLHRGLSASHNWLSIVVDENGKNLSKKGALKYLSKNGLVGGERDSMVERRDSGVAGKDTTMIGLSKLFSVAAERFDETRRDEAMFNIEQGDLLREACGKTIFSGGAGELYLFDLLDTALINAAMAQQPALLAERVTKLEVQMRVVLSLLQRPVTFFVNWVPFNKRRIAGLWGYVPFNKIIAGLWGYVPYNETINGAVMEVLVLGEALISVKE